jgi:hypothetical protein
LAASPRLPVELNVVLASGYEDRLSHLDRVREVHQDKDVVFLIPGTLAANNHLLKSV